ncbi:flagellar biosynthesis protein FlhA [Thermanaerosceptrum fracticalcis]|uniref:Flagellar biosynthesis protein FlhA n=1 Tax=Thermanaerosceptrum fracticalcis TaxID=1712410 RepID=A0A7G6E0Z8_THEFR|nr:flagellar biosynthesis protein FlhA [Thermanaerosceptrum fracticalcis]QNB45752.1 flagellar biosynthesis protein FlhA [Thermanaerosceptrum fracticalcis]
MSTTPLTHKLMRHTDIIVAVGIIAMVIMMIIPLNPRLLDVLLVFNITCSLVILLVAMYNKEPLDFSVFPSLLLVMTLYRLSLNVSSTRLILLEGNAGEVIQQFGQFVVGGNPFVGLVIFLILIVIQFIVITKGAERVAEVAARFTLDAMPGKQMSIDADLNAGLISEDEARKRRMTIQREADFYGAMDGASKFVKGDAIAGIVITIINILGGMAVGLLQKEMGSITEVAKVYTLLTVGDGLVSQIPALLLSTATGIIVTRAASDNSLGDDLTAQVFSQPKVLSIAAGVLLFLGLVPGLPKLPFFLLGFGLAALAYIMYQAKRTILREEAQEAEKAEVAEIKKPDSVYSLLQLDPIELEMGYGLIPLVDTQQGGDLLERVVMIRRQCAVELGLVIPPIRIRDNMQLVPNTYLLKLKGVPLARGEIMLNHYLAMGGDAELPGIPTREPAFGLPAKWISESVREQAELLGFTVVDPPSVLATHLTEFLKNNAADILSRQDIKVLLDNVKKEYPAVVEEVVPNVLSLADVHKVLANLLRERIPIRDMVSILEALGDWGTVTKDTDILTEYVRQKLARQIGQLYSDEEGKLYCITLDPRVEEIVKDSIKMSEHGTYLAINPATAQDIIRQLTGLMEKTGHLGKQLVVLVNPIIRPYFRKLIERVAPSLPVVSYNEIPGHLEVESVGMVKI